MFNVRNLIRKGIIFNTTSTHLTTKNLKDQFFEQTIITTLLSSSNRATSNFANHYSTTRAPSSHQSQKGYSFAKKSINKSPFHRCQKLTKTEQERNCLFYSTENNQIMRYFVIGVSGVTCGGKTTITKLLQKSFPWSHVIHQDKYFHPDEYDGHVRLQEIENHVNYDIPTALDMEKMHKDVATLLNNPPKLKTNGTNGVHHNGDSATPNFEGLELIRSLEDLDIDTSKYSSIPILIIEGFILFGSDHIFDNCDVRFFLTLDEETCKVRRSLRNFDPPDCPGYFENCIWPEYQKHYKKHVEKRHGIHTFSGKSNVRKLWRQSVEAIADKIEAKYPHKFKISDDY